MTSAVAAANTKAATETAAAVGSDASRRGQDAAARGGGWEYGSSSHAVACGSRGDAPAPAAGTGGAEQVAAGGVRGLVAVAAGTPRRSQAPHPAPPAPAGG